MQVLLKFPIDCTADAAWKAIHDPEVAANLYAPVLHLVSDAPLPSIWEPGMEATVTMRALGKISLGKQLIRISDHETGTGRDRVRTMQDSGRPLTGPLSLLKTWDHQMSVRSAPNGTAVWRDQLTITGLLAPVFWLTLWPSWKIREIKIKSLAKQWR